MGPYWVQDTSQTQPFQKGPFSRPKKPMTTTDVIGFYAFFLSARKSGNFLHILGANSLLSYTVNLEKKEKIHWRKFKKSSGDIAPKLQISVPCRGRTCPYLPNGVLTGPPFPCGSPMALECPCLHLQSCLSYKKVPMPSPRKVPKGVLRKVQAQTACRGKCRNKGFGLRASQKVAQDRGPREKKASGCEPLNK